MGAIQPFSPLLRQDLRTILVCICMHKCSQVLTVVNAEALPLCLDSTSGLISKRAMKGDSSILCFQHTLITPFSERDTSSLLQLTTASHLCILMSINYTLNETIKNCRAIDVWAFTWGVGRRAIGPLKINVGEIQLGQRKGRESETVVFNVHLCFHADTNKQTRCINMHTRCIIDAAAHMHTRTYAPSKTSSVRHKYICS